MRRRALLAAALACGCGGETDMRPGLHIFGSGGRQGYRSGTSSTPKTGITLFHVLGHSQGSGPVEVPNPNVWDPNIREWTQFASDFSLGMAATDVNDGAHVTAGSELSMAATYAASNPNQVVAVAKYTKAATQISSWYPNGFGVAGLLNIEKVFAVRAAALADLQAQYPGLPINEVFVIWLGAFDASVGVITTAGYVAYQRVVNDYIFRNAGADARIILLQPTNAYASGASPFSGTATVRAAFTTLAGDEHVTVLDETSVCGTGTPWDWPVGANPHFSVDNPTDNHALRAAGIAIAGASPAPHAIPVNSGTDPATVFVNETVKAYLTADAGFSTNTWSDQSGNGRDATEATNPATRTANDATLNNLPTVAGNGSNKKFTLATLPLASGDTIISVAKINTWTSNASLWGGNNATAAHTLYMQTGSPRVTMYNGNNGNFSLGMVVGQWQLIVCCYAGVAADDLLRCGAQVTQRGTGAGTATGTGINLFARNNSLFGDVAMHNWLMLDRFPKLANLERWAQLMAAKCGSALAY